MTDKRIFNEIKNSLVEKAKKMKKSISWFRFAKKTKTGSWRFLNNKETQWEILEEVAREISKTNKKYTTGQIVDLIADFVNG